MLEKMLDKTFFRSLSNRIRKDYVEHIFEKGKDVFGKRYKPYSKEYGEAKRGNKIKRQSGAFANKVTPVLTGDFMNDAKPSHTRNSASVKFASHGGKVNHLAKMGRKVTDDRQPFPKGVISMIEREVKKEVDSKFPKNKVVRIKLRK